MYRDMSAFPREPLIEPRLGIGGQVQAKLAAPPQDVLCASRPLLSTKILDLAREETREHFLTEIRGLPDQALDAAAVRARVARTQWRRQPGILALHRTQEGGKPGRLGAAA